MLQKLYSVFTIFGYFSDEGFIEVSIDPNKVGPDELFPADIFNTRSTLESQKELVPTSDAEPQYVHSPEPEHTIAELESTETNTGEESRDLVQQFTELVEVSIKYWKNYFAEG